MNKQTIIIAIIAIIIVKLVTGCTTTEPTIVQSIPATSNYQLLPIGDGLFRFNKESGKTEFLVQSPHGMVWLPVVVVPEMTTIPIDLSKDSQSH